MHARPRWPPLSACLGALALVAAASCAPTTAVTAPTVPASSAASDADATTPSDDGGNPDAGDQLSPVLPPSQAARADAGVPARFRHCTTNSDCVAVPRVGCCHNGWQEAVAALQKDAYLTSFACPDAHPICPMFIVRDTRVATCDTSTHLCVMTVR